MNTLHIRSVSDKLYSRIQQLAESKNRSLNVQVIILLELALEVEEGFTNQAKALTSIQRRRFKAPKHTPSSPELLKEDHTR